MITVFDGDIKLFLSNRKVFLIYPRAMYSANVFLYLFLVVQFLTP